MQLRFVINRQYLSHGQKKRVAIAGALVMESEYLLLDEPTAGLDPRGRQHMIDIISRIVGQRKTRGDFKR